MWSYYGSKSKVISFYPKPKTEKIIEPFCGTARYALEYFWLDVLIIDKWSVIVDTWKYLQQCSSEDILNLPDVSKGMDIRKLGLSNEEKNLIGFCINRGSNAPKNIVSGFCSWNEDKKRIAKDLYKIKHWKIYCSSYLNIENEKATWFIDPPYQYGGEHYKENNSSINYSELAKWCKSRIGQVIVCENTKADWLPFYPMRKLSGAYDVTTEAIWSNIPHDFQSRQDKLF